MPLFEDLRRNCDLVFAFDNSQNHHANARSPDALCANDMILGDGGKNTKPKRDGYYGVNNTVQSMITADNKTKGIRTILQERGLWPATKFNLDCQDCLKKQPPQGTVSCCARRLLSSQPDFSNSKNWLQETAEKRNHSIIFFPKYHCELNFIEMVWGYVKSKLRRSCTFDFNDLQHALPNALDNVPIQFVRRAARHCFRFMSGYRQGLEGPLLDYIMKKYTSHRRIPVLLPAKLEEYEALRVN